MTIFEVKLNFQPAPFRKELSRSNSHLPAAFSNLVSITRDKKMGMNQSVGENGPELEFKIVRLSIRTDVHLAGIVLQKIA